MSDLNFVDAPTDVVVQHSGDSVILTAENWEKVKGRIDELENRQSAFNDLVEANAGLSKELDELEAKLDAAKALPEKWRDEHYCPSGGGVDARCSDLANELADELDAALSGKLQPKQGEDV